MIKRQKYIGTRSNGSTIKHQKKDAKNKTKSNLGVLLKIFFSSNRPIGLAGEIEVHYIHHSWE